MNVICPCMKTTYTFEALVEDVAVQAGVDTSVPEDHTKACELATWIALVSAIIGAVIAFFCTTGCANTSFTLSGEQGGQISYSVDENGNLIISGKPPVVQKLKK